MRQDVTVIPGDRIIIVDGAPLWFAFEAPANLHALQWHDGAGEMEWTDDINHPLTTQDYDADVAPFVTLWEAEKARLEEEANRPPIPPTLKDAKAAKLAEINAECQHMLESLTPTYPERELTTFDKQESEARAYTADSTASTPLLSALAQARGVPLDELARRVLVKADAFAVASGSIIGQRQALEDRLDACTTLEEVQGITVNIFMPGVEAGT